MVRTRFSPSPTGSLHIGGVRTALYAYLVAKKAGGEFWLRIEDTDQKRLVEGSREDIIETMKWLGLDFDNLVTQSDRLENYQKHAKQLVEEGKAYEKDGALWFKMDTFGKTVTQDLVGSRKIEFDNKDQKDFVILKSDGFPTYHLAHVVDDTQDQMSPIIRAPEWISSLPKHHQLFKAFGWKLPEYAHVTMILGPDRSKLSKRHGAKAASEFRRDGFLPEAILNYMAFLGWTPPSGKEILSLSEMVQEFDLKDCHVANPVFDITKLEWMNGEYIRALSDEELIKRLTEFLVDHPAPEKIAPLVPLVKERIKKLSDFVPLTYFIFEEPEYERSVFDKVKIEDLQPTLEMILSKMEGLKDSWDSKSFEEAFRGLADERGVRAGEIFQLIRIAVSGQNITPPLFETIELVGRDKVLQRISNLVKSSIFES